MAKAVIFFGTKRYEYNFDYPDEPTLENMALAISSAMVKRDMRRSMKRTHFNMSRYYNLVYLKLKESGNVHYPKSDNTDHVKNAFKHASSLQMTVKPNIKKDKVELMEYRVGITTNTRLIIDIDGNDFVNMHIVRDFYSETLRTDFITIKTGGGFWLISSKEYSDVNEWLYDNCRILNPTLQFNKTAEYIEKLKSLDTFDKKNTLYDSIKSSDLYNGVGSFDVIFTFINIKRKIATLRISKKRKDDRIYLMG